MLPDRTQSGGFQQATARLAVQATARLAVQATARLAVSCLWVSRQGRREQPRSRRAMDTSRQPDWWTCSEALSLAATGLLPPVLLTPVREERQPGHVQWVELPRKPGACA